MIECEDSVSPLWLCVCRASRMALKAVCLSLWSLLNTKKNRYEPSQVPVCSQWIGSGSLGSSVLIVWRSQQNRLFFSFADINSKLNLLCGDKTLFSRWTSKHMLTTVSLCASEDSLMLQECHIVPMFFFFHPVRQTFNQLHNAKPPLYRICFFFWLNAAADLTWKVCIIVPNRF